MRVTETQNAEHLEKVERNEATFYDQPHPKKLSQFSVH